MRTAGVRAAGAVVLAAGVAAALAACGSPGARDETPQRLQVVTTTALLADLAGAVAGDRADVTSLVPAGGDPHSYEPTPRDVRDVVRADVAFSNYLLLEQQAVVRAIDANIDEGVPNVSLAEAATEHGAQVIPLVENAKLDTVWLGLRVAGDGASRGADRSSTVELRAVGLDGPGRLTGYLTHTFGRPEVYFDSGDGFDASDGYAADTVTLPVAAHTHMSWTFDEPGVYRLSLEADLRTDPDGPAVPVGRAEVTFAVGIPPTTADADEGDPLVLDEGHADVAVDLDHGGVVLATDAEGGAHDHHDPAGVVVAVPNAALSPVPAGEGFGFLGRPGDLLFQLPQAVLGKHVHGEIDPHLWHDVRNAVAYVKTIRDTLVEADPAGADEYRANTEAYVDRLFETDAYVASRIAAIPPPRRQLVTTHDAYAYLADAYGLTVAGFVSPNPATEPSLEERRRLSETIRNLDVPAVFLEPNLAARSAVLREVAAEHGIEVCELHGDAFSREVRTYVEMMRANADSLHRCLA